MTAEHGTAGRFRRQSVPFSENQYFNEKYRAIHTVFLQKNLLFPKKRVFSTETLRYSHFTVSNRYWGISLAEGVFHALSAFHECPGDAFQYR